MAAAVHVAGHMFSGCARQQRTPACRALHCHTNVLLLPTLCRTCKASRRPRRSRTLPGWHPGRLRTTRTGRPKPPPSGCPPASSDFATLRMLDAASSMANGCCVACSSVFVAAALSASWAANAMVPPMPQLLQHAACLPSCLTPQASSYAPSMSRHNAIMGNDNAFDSKYSCMPPLVCRPPLCFSLALFLSQRRCCRVAHSQCMPSRPPVLLCSAMHDVLSNAARF